MKRPTLTRVAVIGGALGAALSLCTGTAMASSFHGAMANSHKEYGAIFQIDAGGKKAMKKTLNNIENLLGDPRVKGHIKVELIANSNGVDVYAKGNGFEKKLRHLKAEGVILAQCSNTLHEKHIKRSSLYSFISIVPSGVGEITLREAQGWAYIHPSARNANAF